MKRFHQYIADVQSGKQVAGKLIKLAVERHLNDIKKGICVFDEEAAQIIIDFAEICRHWKGTEAGTRIKLEDWQVFYLGSIFGWKQKNGLRRFKESYLEIARKNGKTTGLAVVSLDHLLFDDEEGSQVLCGSQSEDQSRILVNDVGQIILATPELKDLFTLRFYEGKVTRVVYPETTSFIEPLPRVEGRLDGKDPSMGNIDEFHEAKTTVILDVIKSGMQSRRQPLTNIATTAGFNKSYPCYSVKRATGIKILNGTLEDDSNFPLIFSLDDDDDWSDQGVWVKANPNLNVSVRLENLIADYNQAKNEGGSTEVNFKTKNLNIWTDSADVWIQDEVWQSNTGTEINIEDLRGQRCFVGIDFAKESDLNAMCLIFPYFHEKYVPMLWSFWMCKHKVRDSKGMDYSRWIAQEYIKAVGTPVVYPTDVANDCLQIFDKYEVQIIGYDRYLSTHGATQVFLDNEFIMMPLAQGAITMSAPTIEIYNMAQMKEIEHFGNPVMRWMVSNVELSRDSNNNVKPDKGKSSNKIDGVSAMVFAKAAWMQWEFENGELNRNKTISVYEDRGMLSV